MTDRLWLAVVKKQDRWVCAASGETAAKTYRDLPPEKMLLLWTVTEGVSAWAADCRGVLFSGDTSFNLKIVWNDLPAKERPGLLAVVKEYLYEKGR